MKTVLFCVLFVVPNMSLAGFINNRTAWSNADSRTQGAYVMGAFDGFVVVSPEENDLDLYKLDLVNCAIDMGLKTEDLASIVDTQYQNLDNWDKSPVFVLLGGLRRVCLQSINKARISRGQTAFEH